MNLKVFLFFSIIILILSAGAVSSADVDFNVTDSSVVGDGSLDVDFNVTDSSVVGDGSLDVDSCSLNLSSNGNDVAVEDDNILDESNYSLGSNDRSILWDIGNKANSSDLNESLEEDNEYHGKIPREHTIPIDLKQDIDALIEKLNNLKSVHDVICEAHDLDGLNLYVSFMDNNGTASGDGIREKIGDMYQANIPKNHSNTLILKNDIATIEKKLIIKITNAKEMIIDGQGHTIDLKGSSKHDHYFVVKSGNITFKNINFINGYNKDGDKGGAISFEDNALATIINCTFRNCWAEDYGGAIADRTGNTLTLINSSFIGNTAHDNNGGAIFCKGLLYVEGCLFDFNDAGVDGGAIFCEKDVNVIKSVFNCNKAAGVMVNQCYGGAIRAKGTAYIDNSTFENNTSADYGGAIYAKNIKINQNQGKQSFNTFFLGNKAGDNDGGALYADNDVFAKNALFKGNKAYEDGGAIFSKSDVTIDNCLFETNKASGAKLSQCYGGAIRAKGTAYIDNSTFENNTSADYGGAVYAKNIKINRNQDKNQSINAFFFGNKAGDNNGGALYADDDVIVINALFKGNKACEDGGGIFTEGVTNAYYCVFLNNTADGAVICSSRGGGICSESGVNVENSTFKDNFAFNNGPAIYCIKDININQKSNGENYISHFINNTVKGDGDQVNCDKDHGKIRYSNTNFGN